jgi:ABC-2 type transport system permease protein
MFYIKMLFEPLRFFGVIVNFPSMPIGVVLLIFPVTASFQAMLRLGASDVPVWQIIGGVGVLDLTVLVWLSLSMKIFKKPMILYGKRPGVAEIGQALKTACGLRLISWTRSAPKSQGGARMCGVLCG